MNLLVGYSKNIKKYVCAITYKVDMDMKRFYFIYR